MKAGSYTGNATDNRDITGVGFQPKYGLIKSDGKQGPVHRPAALAGDSTLRFTGTPNSSNAIQALQSDGFQVGTDATVNGGGVTYFWMAFAATPATRLAITSVNGGVN